MYMRKSTVINCVDLPYQRNIDLLKMYFWTVQLSFDYLCDVICEKIPYRGKNVVRLDICRSRAST